MSTLATTPHAILSTVFGYPAFRGHQQAAIEHVVSGGNALVLMPTGGGKSLCYQIPAIARRQQGRGITLVISPLIALMHDQVGALIEVGVSAAFLNSSLSNEAASEVEQLLLRGEITLLYAAPERVSNPRFLGLLESLYERGLFSLCAIDEAHCVSQWGHDFRPEYRALSVLHERFPATPRIALTATADALTRADIIEKLSLQSAAQFVSSFDRPNIHYRLVEKTDARKQLLRFIQSEHAQDAGIVYCQSRKKVEDFAELLCQHGVRALPYHAGLDREVRQNNQDAFLRSEEPTVMVATIAFGMGIDKPDVRFVAHVDMPKNIEGYYQETGRAGRDGQPANAWLCYGLQDVVNQRRMIDESPADETYKQLMRGKLDALLTLAEAMDCRRGRLLAYFDDAALIEPDARLTYRCNNCDNCLSPAATWDATQAARKLISCIYRVQQASSGYGFGAGHIMDILRGKATDKVLQFKHEGLSTFGIGSEVSELQWRAVLRQLIALDLIHVDTQAYNTLSITPSATAFLRGNHSLRVRETSPAKRADASARRSSGSKDALASELSPAARNALAALKHWRAEVAKTNNLPAYVIFHDATLAAIATLAPRTLEALGTVSGLGAKKLDSYGHAVLRVLSEAND